MPTLWRRLFPPSTPSPFAVRCDEDLVSVAYDNGAISQFTWSQVQCVRAWKLDCGVVDCIFLSFDLESRTINVHEEVRGYHDLVQVMESRLSKLRRDWWSCVAFPAFATNHTVVWSRSETHSEDTSDHSKNPRA